MKKIFILLALLGLIGCSTAKKPRMDQGVSCAKMGDDKTEETCVFSDTHIDRTRWHYLRPWEKDAFGDMPDLN